jgi:hypothetical protein
LLHCSHPGVDFSVFDTIPIAIRELCKKPEDDQEGLEEEGKDGEVEEK